MLQQMQREKRESGKHKEKKRIKKNKEKEEINREEKKKKHEPKMHLVPNKYPPVSVG